MNNDNYKNLMSHLMDKNDKEGMKLLIESMRDVRERPTSTASIKPEVEVQKQKHTKNRYPPKTRKFLSDIVTEKSKKVLAHHGTLSKKLVTQIANQVIGMAYQETPDLKDKNPIDIKRLRGTIKAMFYNYKNHKDVDHRHTAKLRPQTPCCCAYLDRYSMQ